MADTLLNLFANLDAGMATFVVVVFFLAGIIKGVVGFGMPLFAITVLAFVMPLSAAIATNVGPSMVTNVVQALRGPYFLALLKRLWPFLVPAIGLIWFGIGIQVQVDPAYPGLALGVLAILFALVSFSKLKLAIPQHRERVVGFLIGIVNGIVTGITGIFIIPGGLFLQALGLKRDELVQALGLLFMLSTLTIGIVFTIRSLMTPGLVLLSLLAIVPGLLGMRIGEALRKRLSEELFRVLFLSGIGIIGLSLVIRNGALLMG
ncbi:MAG: sulfite exporter TauE/SafE family protein [Pseudomonadota bacterium]